MLLYCQTASVAKATITSDCWRPSVLIKIDNRTDFQYCGQCNDVPCALYNIHVDR